MLRLNLLLLLVLSSHGVETNKISLDDPLPPIILARNSEGMRPKNVTILMSINHGGTLLPFKATGAVAVKIALERIRNITNFLPDYEIIIQPFEDFCTRSVTVHEIVTRLNDNGKNNVFPMILGPFCSGHIYSGQIIHHYNFVGATTLTIVPDFQNDRRRYSSFYVGHATPSLHFVTLVDFCYDNGWRKLAVISEITPYFNTLEREMLTRMEQRNMSLIGLVKIPFISGQAAEENRIASAVEDLAKTDPRIIAVNSNTPVGVACWLHRYHLYGPRYVIFIQTAFTFAPNDKTRYSWCTEKMLFEVMTNIFFYGDTSKVSLMGKATTKDSTGFTGGQLDEALKAEIDNPESHFHWKVRYRLYDVALLAAFWLNSTENLLRIRNETLSDWTTASENFRHYGSSFLQLQRQSLYDLKVAGLQSDYGYEAQSDDNTGGFAPIGIFQVKQLSQENFTVTLVPVAVYKPARNHSIAKVTTIPTENITWLTPDGQPPNDSLHIVKIYVATFRKKAWLVVLKLVAALGVLFSLFFFFMQIVRSKEANKRIRRSVPTVNNVILFGDHLLFCHTFFIPSGIASSIDTSCNGMYWVFIVGVVLVLNAMMTKIELASVIHVTQIEHLHKHAQRGHHFRLSEQTVSASYRIVFIVVITVSCVMGFLAFLWIFSSPFTLISVTDDEHSASPRNATVAYQDTWYECARNNKTDTSTGALAILLTIEGLLVIRACFVANMLRKRKLRVVDDLLHIITAFYASVLLVLAGAAICVLVHKRAQSFQYALSLSTMIFAAVNLGTVFAPKLVQRGGYFVPCDRPAKSREKLTTLSMVTINTIRSSSTTSKSF